MDDKVPNLGARMRSTSRWPLQLAMLAPTDAALSQTELSAPTLGCDSKAMRRIVLNTLPIKAIPFANTAEQSM